LNASRSAAKPRKLASRRPGARRKRAVTEYGTPAADVLMQFRTIIRTVRNHYRQVQERCGVSGAQLWALAAVEAGKGIKVNDVARHLAIHQSTASNLLDKLEAMSMVERRRSDDDRRVVCVHITTVGRALLRRAPKPPQGVLPGALQALSGHEVRALRAHLDSLIRRMHIRVTSNGMTPMAEILSDSAPTGGRRRGRS
jgi:DNA-binding MarR family transcriptional regulator